MNILIMMSISFIGDI